MVVDINYNNNYKTKDSPNISIEITNLTDQS
jgi:hypothetical protein